jgi:hypothetical protein
MSASGSLAIADCLETGYQLPQFWNRSVFFVANLKSLFLGNREQTAELIRLVGELDSYGGRLVPVFNLLYGGKDNALLLECEPDPTLLGFFRDELKLEIPQIEVYSYADYEDMNTSSLDAFMEALPSEFHCIDGYVTDDKLLSWASALNIDSFSNVEGYRIGNNKTELYHYLRTEGLPTPDTHLCDSEESVSKAINSLRKSGYHKAVIRSGIGASGIGMTRVDFSKTLTPSVPQMFFHSGPCLVQGWFEKGVGTTEIVHSPSVQFFLDEASAHLFDITDQILSGSSVHEGNQSPPILHDISTQRELIRQARKVGEWLHGIGYRGMGSADFIVVENTDHSKDVYVCEVNARITGATYPSVLARHLLPGGAWFMRNIQFETKVEGENVISLMQDTDCLFREGSSRGVVPLNFNFDPQGKVRKGQFLCLSDQVAECQNMLDEMRATFPLETSVARD